MFRRFALWAVLVLSGVVISLPSSSCFSTLLNIAKLKPEIRGLRRTGCPSSKGIPQRIPSAASSTPRRFFLAMSESQETPNDGHNELEIMQFQYTLGGVTLMIAWTACALGSLATYKPHRIVHNSIGVLQAMTALPLIWTSTSSLSKAANAGWHRLRLPEFRRLNLGLAAACLWSAVTVVWAPSFTAAVVRTSDPVIYAPPLRAIATIVHLGVAALCIDTWTRSVPAPASVWRAIDGFLGSLFHWGPNLPFEGSNDAGHSPRTVYAFLSLCFATFTALAVFAPFPLATVPSLLGKRMARAFGAWTLLATVFFCVLKDGALPSLASSMRSALLIFSSSHLLVAVARPVLESAQVYPAALACLPATAAAYAVYLLALCTALRDRGGESDRVDVDGSDAAEAPKAP